MACDLVGASFEGRVRRLFPAEHNCNSIRPRVCLRLEDLLEDMEARCWSRCRTIPATLPPRPRMPNPAGGRGFDVDHPTRRCCTRVLEFGLLEHLDKKLLLKPMHSNFYAAGACRANSSHTKAPQARYLDSQPRNQDPERPTMQLRAQ